MTRRVACLLLILGLTVSIEAQVPFPKECPQVSIVESFDLDAYMGVWYEYSRYPFIAEAVSKCVYARYKNLDNEKVDVENASENIITGSHSSTKGFAYVKAPGQLAVVFNSRQNKDKANYLVLGTDYTSYAVVYSCSSLTTMAHTKLLWILTREREPSQATIDAAKTIIQKNNLSESFLMRTTQTNCPDVNSQANAANPSA